MLGTPHEMPVINNITGEPPEENSVNDIEMEEGNILIL